MGPSPPISDWRHVMVLCVGAAVCVMLLLASCVQVLTIRVEVKRDETKRQLKVADAAEEGAGAEAAEGGKAGGKK